MNGGEFAGFAQRKNGGIELAGANHIDAAAHAFQRVEHQAGQNRAEENGDEERRGEGEPENLESGIDVMLQEDRLNQDGDIEQHHLFGIARNSDRQRGGVILAAGHQVAEIFNPAAALQILEIMNGRQPGSGYSRAGSGQNLAILVAHQNIGDQFGIAQGALQHFGDGRIGADDGGPGAFPFFVKRASDRARRSRAANDRPGFPSRRWR